MVLDLTEILDLSERGMAIQSSAPLVPDRTMNFVLDLSETKSYINTSGYVVWADDSGRAGIQFSTMSDYTRRRLKEWMFVNALAAFAKGAAKAAHAVREEPEINSPQSLPEQASSFDELVVPEVVEEAVAQLPTPVVAPTERVETAVDAPMLNALQQKVEALGSNRDAALALLADSAQRLTRASGAAIALAHGDELVCRASSGEAPGLGARFHVGSGFSGECVRTAQLQRCDDAEMDPLVDRESCRALGICSMIASPVLSGGRVVGLLEVFSPNPYAFCEADEAALRRLSEIVAQTGAPGQNARRVQNVQQQAVSQREQMKAWPPAQGAPVQRRAARPLKEASQKPRPQTRVTEDDEISELVEPSPTRSKVLLITVAATLLIAAMAMLGSWFLRSHRADGSSAPQTALAASPAWKNSSQPMALDELRKRALDGDRNAQYAMGARYYHGDEVKQDYSEAVRWFSQAAEQGHPGAQTALGAYYWAGRGVAPDLGKAYYWSLLARENGDQAARFRVTALAARMSKGQVKEAQQLANDWLRQHNSTPVE